ncbi:MAG: hypothetical protein R3B57_14870 [Phycisphaerales bacterium]
MGYMSELIGACGQRSIGIAAMMNKGVTPEMFARLPTKDGKPVQTNHPAFVYGHLSIYPARLLEMAGEDPSAVALPEEQLALFTPKAECLDDPEGTIYPPMPDVMQRFMDGYTKALQRFGEWDDAKLAGPHQGAEAYQKLAPTLGIAATFFLTTHMAMHLGQVSAWRRFMGLGSVFG